MVKVNCKVPRTWYIEEKEAKLIWRDKEKVPNTVHGITVHKIKKIKTGYNFKFKKILIKNLIVSL